VNIEFTQQVQYDAIDFATEDKKNEEKENPPPCNFFLLTQGSLFDEEGSPQYFTQDLGEEEDTCNPPELALQDFARVIKSVHMVKLGLFDPDPYPGECDFSGTTPPGCFPFGCMTTATGAQVSPICCTASFPGRLGSVSTGLHTALVKCRLIVIQMLLLPTPTDHRCQACQGAPPSFCFEGVGV
jgi:hypothetical protein